MRRGPYVDADCRPQPVKVGVGFAERAKCKCSVGRLVGRSVGRGRRHGAMSNIWLALIRRGREPDRTN